MSERNFDFAFFSPPSLFLSHGRHSSIVEYFVYFLSPLKGPRRLSCRLRIYSIEIFAHMRPAPLQIQIYTRRRRTNSFNSLLCISTTFRRFIFFLLCCCCCCWGRWRRWWLCVCVSVLVSSEYVISIPILGHFPLWISVFSLRYFSVYSHPMCYLVWNGCERHSLHTRFYDGKHVSTIIYIRLEST